MRQLEGLLEAYETHRMQTVVVRNGERFDFAPVESIDRIETANNCTCLPCVAKG